MHHNAQALTFFPPRVRLFLALAGTALLLSASAGAAAQQQKKDNKVEISTPWGGATASTEATLKDLGLPAYPGARLRKENPSDDPEATLSFWTASLGFKLVAMKYESDDPVGKISEFYQKALAKHGKVLKCTAADKKAKPHEEDSKELDCSDTDVKPGGVELRAGTKERRHIVAIMPKEKGTGSEFAIVYLEVSKKSKEPL